MQLNKGQAPDERLTDGIGLCLSGGGYRAMLFQAGALWRLNELGYLPRLDRISSVSGGSITAGVLASRWNQLSFDQNGIATNYKEVVVAPLRGLAGKTIDALMNLGPDCLREPGTGRTGPLLFSDAICDSLEGRGQSRRMAVSEQAEETLRPGGS